jgi:hypothetical protein
VQDSIDKLSIYGTPEKDLLFDFLCKVVNNMSSASIEVRKVIKLSPKFKIRRFNTIENPYDWVRYHTADNVFRDMRKVLDEDTEIRRFDFVISKGIITTDEKNCRGKVECNVLGWKVFVPQTARHSVKEKEYFEITHDSFNHYNTENVVQL